MKFKIFNFKIRDEKYKITRRNFLVTWIFKISLFRILPLRPTPLSWAMRLAHFEVENDFESVFNKVIEYCKCVDSKDELVDSLNKEKKNLLI